MLRFSENELTTCDVIEIFKSSSVDDWNRGDDGDDAAFGHSKEVLISLWAHPRGYELRYGYQCIAIVTGPAGLITHTVEI